jgi:hypothetical protein
MALNQTSGLAPTHTDRALLPQGVNEVKFQVIRLMRMLVQICQTLESVPEEVRCLTHSFHLRHMSRLTSQGHPKKTICVDNTHIPCVLVRSVSCS